MGTTRQYVLDQLLGHHPTPSEVKRSLVIDFGRSLLPNVQGESSYLQQLPQPYATLGCVGFALGQTSKV